MSSEGSNPNAPAQDASRTANATIVLVRALRIDAYILLQGASMPRKSQALLAILLLSLSPLLCSLNPLLRQNDFGGVLGGPIIKDRLFFPDLMKAP